ncbi:MAG: DMT family transporter [Candidatus Diapherotrites archaeon]|nr:DMT family transporter [Candidatus Micrarchaeota archaeon]
MKPYLYAVLAAICFSTVGIFVKFIGGNVPIMTISFFRVFIGLLLLAIVVPRIDPHFLKQTPRDLIAFAGIGFLLAAEQAIYNTAFLHTGVSNTVLIHSLWVMFSAVLAFFILKEKITRQEGIAFIVAFAGLAIINPLAPEQMFGNALALLAAVAFALLIVLMRLEDRSHTVSTIFWIMLFASIFLLPFPLLQGAGDWFPALPWLIGIGAISTGLAYLFTTFALEKIHADHYSAIEMVVLAVSAIALAVLLLGEALTRNLIVGGALLILAGCIVHIGKGPSRGRLGQSKTAQH